MQQLLQFMTGQKIPEVARIKEFVPTIEKRAKISVSDHLGKQPLTSLHQAKTESYGKYYGEVNKSGDEHGRGIRIWDDGTITIGYHKNGDWGTGKCIEILSNGWFRVGEIYQKEG